MYDLHNHLLLKNNAKTLEYFKVKGAGVIFADSFDEKKFSELKKNSAIDLFSGVEIHAERKGDVKRGIDKFRKKVDLILVHAQDPRAMRTASENKKVDVIAHAFLDQTAAREARKNGVAVEINFRDFLGTYGMKRAIFLSKLSFNLNLARKYKIPVVLTTGAHSIYDMRSPNQITALAECIGLTPVEAKKGITEVPRKIVEKNKRN